MQPEKQDPRCISAAEFEQEVRAAVKGARNPGQAESRIKARFSSRPAEVSVQKVNEQLYAVAVRQNQKTAPAAFYCAV